MTVLRLPVRAALALVVVADMLAFSRATLVTLVVSSLGTAMIMIGLYFAYRPAAALGMLVVVATAASSMEFVSILTVGELLSASLGLLLPACLLAWLSLTAEDEGAIEPSMARMPALLTALYALICVLSAPVFLLLLGLVSPTMSATISTVTESALMLVTAALVGLAFASRAPRPKKASGAEESE